MKISLIAAMSLNRAIGKQGQLPWQHIPADWGNLFSVTAGKKMIMGRKSYESPQRIWSKEGNIVITRQADYVIDEGFMIANSVHEALDIYRNEDEVFVLGGEEIFRQTLVFADFIYLTIVQEFFEGDAFFPEFNEKDFEIIEQKDFAIGENTPYDISILIYRRKS
jgi:dihydrofolate reductase